MHHVVLIASLSWTAAAYVCGVLSTGIALATAPAVRQVFGQGRMGVMMELVVRVGQLIYTADIEQCWHELNARTDIFYPDRAGWMIPDLIGVHGADYGVSAFRTRVKNVGELLTADQKRAMGINTRIKIGSKLAVTLTPKGLADVNASIDAIFLAPIVNIWRRSEHDQAVRMEAPMSLRIYDPTSLCLPALALHGQIFMPEAVPDFPLSGCDRLCCDCVARVDHKAYDEMMTEFSNELEAIFAEAHLLLPSDEDARGANAQGLSDVSLPNQIASGDAPGQQFHWAMLILPAGVLLLFLLFQLVN